MTRRRVVVFAEPRSFIANVLVQATIDACRNRSDVELVAVFDAGRTPLPASMSRTRLVARSAVKRLFDPEQVIVLHRPMWRTFYPAAERAGIPVIAPERRNVNDPAFVAWLRDEIRPDLALSLISLQIFGSDLLSSFSSIVNYHNGLLPAYRGLRATGWSLYNGEERTGFSFHHMTAGIDAGPVLYEDAVTVRPGATTMPLEWEKTTLAAHAVGRVIDAMLLGDPGRTQTGPAAYYSHQDGERIRRIDNPASVSWDDLQWRLRAFESVEMTLGGRPVRVTKVKRIERRSTARDFQTADAVPARATRLRYLPPLAYSLSRRLGAGPNVLTGADLPEP